MESTPAPPPDPRVLTGRILFAAGALALPLGIGIALGWYAGDRGVRWMPTLLGALCLFWIGSLLLMILGSRLEGSAGQPAGRKRVALAALGIVLLAGVRMSVAWLEQPSPLTSLDLPTYRRVYANDAARYQELSRTLDRSLRVLAEQEALSSDPPRVLSADEEAAVADAWEAYVHGAFALDRIRSFYEDYYRYDTGRAERGRHLRSYLLTFAAELSLYEHTAQLIELVLGNDNVRTFLNVARPERGLAEDSLAFVREELAGLTDLSRVLAGEKYLEWLDLTFAAEEEARAEGYHWLWREVQGQLQRIGRRNKAALAQLTVAADWAPIRRKLKHLTFPVQKEVAEAMGDTKVLRRGSYLIRPEQLSELRKELEPGDVLLGRKNWYLSNLGLPGFWPHAMLYVGSDAELARLDADPEVQAWLKSEGQASLVALLASRTPRAWDERGADAELCVIEAVGEGVLQHDLPHASGDYLAALRPRLSALDKAKAIARAFGYLGRPYDFDFDFATDHALVCSELVWRSYRPQGGSAGLDLPTVRVAGRETVPPQEFVKRYVSERDLDPSQQLFDFVLFVDAIEAEGRAYLSDEAGFRKTAERAKWDVSQR